MGHAGQQHAVALEPLFHSGSHRKARKNQRQRHPHSEIGAMVPTRQDAGSLCDLGWAAAERQSTGLHHAGDQEYRAAPGGEAFPNPAKASKNAGRWERFELHRAGMLTAKQRKRRAAATATGVSDTPEHQPSSRTESIAAAAPAVSAAAHSSTLNPLAHAFIPTSTWRDDPPPMSPARLGDMQEDLALQAALRSSAVEFRVTE